MTDRRSRHRRLAALASLAALLLLTIIPASVARGATEVSINLRASGLQALTQVTNAGDGTDRLFLVEKRLCSITSRLCLVVVEAEVPAEFAFIRATTMSPPERV